MMRPVLLAALLLSLATITAARENTLEALVMEKGRCNSLKSLSSDLTARCSNVLANTNYRDGRAGFNFVTDDGLAITFSGDGKGQIKPNPDIAIQPIDLVIFGRDHETRKAVGSCRFSNPFHGIANVDCEAETAIGSFKGSFTTDGGEPKVTRF